MQKILIVDDESIFREYLRTALDWEAYGFEICAEAKNGIEALEQAQLHRPDIALVDITMPFMDGLTSDRAVEGAISGYKRGAHHRS